MGETHFGWRWHLVSKNSHANTACSARKIQGDSFEGIPWQYGAPRDWPNHLIGKRTLLLALYATGHWTLRDSKVFMFETKETQLREQGTPVQYRHNPNLNRPPLILCISTSMQAGTSMYWLSLTNFSRFSQAYAMTSKSAKTVAYKLLNDYALKFGFPQRIHHDQGGEFQNRLLEQLKQTSGVQGSWTTPYHTEGNGQVERFNRILMQMLDLVDLCIQLPVTKSQAFLLFGRAPRLPVDILFRLRPETGTPDHR